MGLLRAATVKREFGCAAGPFFGSYGWPFQSTTGVNFLRPSHQGSSSAVSATFVKSVSRLIMSKALRLVSRLVPGTTPKYPASGLIAQSRPSGPGCSHEMSSPTVSTRQPGIDAGGISMARLVLPHADGNAAHI